MRSSSTRTLTLSGITSSTFTSGSETCTSTSRCTRPGVAPLRSTWARKLPGSSVRQLWAGAEMLNCTGCTSLATTSPGESPLTSTGISVG